MRKEIIMVGQGGQGIVLMGALLSKALIREGKEVANNSSYGAEARGGACSSQIVISEEKIDFPGVLEPDILVAMSQEGYNTWISKMSSESKIFFDVGLVKTTLAVKLNHIPVPATKVATGLGSKLTANMVMLGVFVQKTKIVQPESVIEIIKKELKNPEINVRAFTEGFRKIGE